MARNFTWCFMCNLLKHNNYIGIKTLPQQTAKRFQRAVAGYSPVANDNTSNIDYQEAKTYQEYLEENQTGQSNSVKTLTTLLELRRETAVKITKKWTIFNTLSKSAVLKSYDVLRLAGAFKSTLRQNVFALADTPDNIMTKITFLNKIRIDINHGIALFQLTTEELSAFAELTLCDRKRIPEYDNRIEYLAHKFDSHTSTICAVACHQPIILIVNITKLIHVTEFLLDEVGMKPENLLNDLVIYHYGLGNIKERVERSMRAGISPIKPWVIRCPISNIEKWEERKKKWDALVGPNATLEEHMSKVMNCDVQYIFSLLTRDPYIKSICIVKLTNMLQYLASVGYKIHDIYRTTKILHRAEEGIKQKYQTWIDAGLEQPPLSLMVLTEKHFEEKLQQQIATKKLSHD